LLKTKSREQTVGKGWNDNVKVWFGQKKNRKLGSQLGTEKLMSALYKSDDIAV
jgi:hypothetical protein